ncbi:uncharacterized protein LOC113279196 [Papaver somniferum]|uniref:uncharacterized protein LOC113279196 n=1 Tax=Papaver somniferum TaxID=3469 RepID=UPI000E701DFA|nr:uncharacterized protein LOC113279196 [Papaver somniferum]
MEGSTSTQTAKRDVFHAYCTVMPDGKKLKCNFCEKEISSGISRIKLHLAQQRDTVARCMHVPPEVKNLAKVALEEKRKEKRQRREESDNEDSEQVYHNEPWNPVCGIDEEEPDFHAEEEQVPVTQKKKTGFLKNLFGRKNKNIHDGQDDVGPRNIVQLVTDQGSQFKVAGKRLASEYDTFFWFPCAAHVLDLMLEDMEKFPFVKDVIGEARQISKFIYNHGWVLARFRQHSAGRNLLCPCLTRFSTNFIAIKSIIDQRNAIESLFLEKVFLKSEEAKTKQARQVKNIISNEMFWTTCQNACIMVGPLLKMIRFLDSDKPTMGYLFHALATCVKTIQMDLGSNRNASIVGVIKKRWKSQLSSPLHDASYFLNPYYIFNPATNLINNEISEPQICLTEVISKMEGRMQMMRGQFASPLAHIAAQHGDPYNLKLEQQRIKGKARRHNIDVHDVHSLLRDDNMLDWIAGEDETSVLPQEEQWLNMLEEKSVNNSEHVPLPYN